MAKYKNKIKDTVSQIQESPIDIEIIFEENIPILIEESEKELFEIDELVQVTSFYVRALNGMTGRFKGISTNGQAIIELSNGTRVLFKKDNIQKVS